MNPRVRALRFARVTEPAGLAGGEIIAQIRLDESDAVAGVITRSTAGWRHHLADGSTSGLVSRHSRQDLERQIVLHHFGALPVALAGDEPPPKHWFAAAG
ncbi:MAG: hypothetical protein H7343_10705 [Undibacterium sp.]|nr:hypothetical protein [Opitutaceae bacterium]